MILDRSQEAALGLMLGRGNVFLTGMAGTGKSTVVGEFVRAARGRVDMVASTGVAALNLRDNLLSRTGEDRPVWTLHRWAGMLLGPRAGQGFGEFFRFLESQGGAWAEAKRRIRAAQTLVIDEVSMVPGRMLDYLDFHCRRIRGWDEPFGGIRVVASGDFLQLPPVAADGRYDWAFASGAWAEAGFRAAVLDTIHRQDDEGFIAILADLREGRVRGATASALRARVARFPHKDLLRLFTHNVQVDKWNAYRMEELDGPGVLLAAETGGPPAHVEFLRKNLVTPALLELRRGARVMVTRNIPDGAGGLVAVNGQTGTVAGWREAGRDRAATEVYVKCDGFDEPISVTPEVWGYDPQDRASGWFLQVPLRAAWAATIHKTQGLSLPAALADVRAAREPGQAYVACSRVRGLGGLWLKDWFAGVAVSDAAIRFHRGLAANREAVPC